MRTKTSKHRRVLSKTIPLTGGLNEEVSNLEMNAGELFECLNYEEIDGAYHGYRSITGFERWDGTFVSFEYPEASGEYIDVRKPSDVPVTKNTDGTVVDQTEYFGVINVTTEDEEQVTTEVAPLDDITTEDYTLDFTEREARREEIEPVPGTGPVLMCEYYQGILYAIREGKSGITPTGYTKLWYMHEGTDLVFDPGGWVEVEEWPEEYLINDIYENPYRVSFCQLAFWPSEHPNTESLAMANGVGNAIMLHRDALGNHVVEEVEDTHLPTGLFPTIPLFFENRLYLAYEEGSVFFSELGDITFDPIYFAGEVYLGWPIHDMVASPGSAIVCWMEKGIKVFKKVEMNNEGTALTPITIETFSDISSSIPKTATRFLGTMIFSDDRGATTMETSDAFGDFKASSISKRVHRTYEDNKNLVLCGYTNREKNQ